MNQYWWENVNKATKSAYLTSSQVALVVKNTPANAGEMRDIGLNLGSRRSPGGGHGNPLQYSCLETPMDRGAWRATVYGVAKSDTTEAQHTLVPLVWNKTQGSLFVLLPNILNCLKNNLGFGKWVSYIVFCLTDIFESWSICFHTGLKPSLKDSLLCD